MMENPQNQHHVQFDSIGMTHHSLTTIQPSRPAAAHQTTGFKIACTRLSLSFCRLCVLIAFAREAQSLKTPLNEFIQEYRV